MSGDPCSGLSLEQLQEKYRQLVTKHADVTTKAKGKLVELSNALKSTQADKSVLENTLAQFKALTKQKVQALRQKIATLEEDKSNTAPNGDAAALEEQNQSLKAKIDAQTAKAVETKNALAAVTAERDQLRDKSQSLRETLGVVRTKTKEKIEKMKDRHAEEVEKLIARADQAENAHHTLLATLDEVRQQVAVLQEEREEAQKVSAATMEDMEQRLAEQSSQLKDEATAAELKLSEQRATLESQLREALEHEASEHRQALEIKQEEHSAAVRTLEQELASQTQAQADDLNAELAEAESLRSGAADKENQIKTLVREYQACQDQLSEAESKLLDNEKAMTELREQSASKNQELEHAEHRLQSKLQSASEDAASQERLGAELSQAQEEIRQLHSELSQTEASANSKLQDFASQVEMQQQSARDFMVCSSMSTKFIFSCAFLRYRSLYILGTYHDSFQERAGHCSRRKHRSTHRVGILEVVEERSRRKRSEIYRATRTSSSCAQRS